uniref:Uncharacterized protein n=1 Tax=Biomphalaria glabrata TaxID=6526 RepID=A0A2C9KPF0_BIOGL
MSSEVLTQKALQQHDKIHPKLIAKMDKKILSMKVEGIGRLLSRSESNKSLPNIKERSRLLSRSDSNNSVPTGSVKGRSRLHSRSDSNKSFPYGYSDAGTSSRHSMGTPRPSAGLSVFRLVAAARAWKRMSQKKLAIPEVPQVLLENTYRLGPEPQEKFHAHKVELMMDDVLTRYLRHFKYTPDSSKQMCLAISSEVKSRVKGMGFPRYKFVCIVFLFQNKGQGSEVSSRCLWSPGTDSYASCTFQNKQFICVVNVHAVYFE